MIHHTRSRRMAIFLGINWAGLAVCFGWISQAQGNINWWRGLNWHNWQNDLAAVAQLGMMPASNLPIFWLLLSCVLTAVWLPTRSAAPATPAESEPLVENKQSDQENVMETHPELREKILRLRQSLEKI